MSARCLARALVFAGLAATVLVTSAHAQEARDRTVLDNIAKDLGLNLLSKPDDTLLRLPLPLAPERWSFFGRLQPYAALSPRVYSQAVEDILGMAPPIREPGDDFSKGLGLGAGLSWHLSDRLELFGEYQFLNMGGRSSQPEGSLGRRDLDNPGLKGGFSIRF